MIQHDFGQIFLLLCPWGARHAEAAKMLGEPGIDRLWAMGDGHGRLSVRDLERRGLARNWLHIRNSSDGALDRIYDELRRRGLAR